MASESAILSWMLALPLAGGAMILAMPGGQVKHAWIGARSVAMTFAVATLLVAAMGAGLMDFTTALPQLQQSAGWMKSSGIPYAVAADGISMVLSLMFAAVGVMNCWASYGIKQGHKGYFSLLLFAQSAALSAVIMQNDVMIAGSMFCLVAALYLLMAGWGGDRKIPAARRFLYMALAGSCGIFVGLTLINNRGITAGWLWILIAGFGVLTAGVPLHLWLSDALAESVTPVGMLIVSLVQTVGGYGIWKFLPLLITAQSNASEWVAWIGIATAAYSTLAAIGQNDLMRMAANVSTAQMGFYILGVAMRSNEGGAGAGAAFLLVGHAVSAAMMVYVCGMIRDRMGHCSIDRLGGLAGTMPAFAGWSAVAVLGAMGLPGLCGFIGEFIVVLGTFGRPASMEMFFYSGSAPTHTVAWMGTVAALIMVTLMGAAIWTYQRIFIGVPRAEHSNVAQMSHTERWILAVFGMAVLGLGLAPMLVTEAMSAAVRH